MGARLVILAVVLTLLGPLPAEPGDGMEMQIPSEPSALLVTALAPAAAARLGHYWKHQDRPPRTSTGQAALEPESLQLPALPPRPKVSVVIPTHNRAHVVGEAVASVLAQGYANLEVIVVDDGSTDDTEAGLGRIADPRLRYVKRPHAGVAAARNAGIAIATGELVSFLDSDDLWKPDKLETEVAFLRGHPEVHAVFSDLEKIDGAVHVPSFMRTTAAFSRRLASTAHPDGLVLPPAEMFRHLLEEVPVKTAGLTMRRDMIERAGRFDEAWASGEDWEFLLRFARTGRFAYLDRALAIIRISPDSLHRARKERDHQAMLGLLARERRRVGDRATRAAARRGIVALVKHLGWYYVASHHRRAACAAYVRGFVQTADVGLLLRAAALLLPRNVGAGLRAPMVEALRERWGHTVGAARNLGALMRPHRDAPPAGLTPTPGR